MITASTTVLIPVEIPARDCELMIMAFCAYYNCTREQILGGFRTIETSRRRGLFFYLLIEELRYTRSGIANEYNIPRTTISSIVTSVEFELNKYSLFKKDKENVLKMFRQIKNAVAKLTEDKL